MSDDLVILDAEDKSLSVAQARHLARAKMLIPALDSLFEIGQNPGVKAGDRVTALKEIIKFASEAQSDGNKQVSRLSPEAARLLLKLGADPSGIIRGVVPDDKEKERLGAGDVDESSASRDDSESSD